MPRLDLWGVPPCGSGNGDLILGGIVGRVERGGNGPDTHAPQTLVLLGRTRADLSLVHAASYEVWRLGAGCAEAGRGGRPKE